MHCPVCHVRTGVRPEPPWLAVSCGTCGEFRITIPAAEIVGLYGSTLRQRVSSRLRRASLDEAPVDVDLKLLEELALSRSGMGTRVESLGRWAKYDGATRAQFAG